MAGAGDKAGSQNQPALSGQPAASQSPVPSTAPHFRACLDFVLRMEGGEVNHPNDPGGHTKYGISQRAYPELDIVSLTLEQAGEIYHRDYWLPCHCDQLPPALALALFDCAVNCGKGRAIALLQAALGVQIDGVIGSRTVAAASRQYRSGLVKFLTRRVQHYVELARVNDRYAVFLGGWLARCFHCHEAALRLGEL